ncbi:aminotransferase class I/II-fold pyridoxal phosphate-dependent enzyme [uncultured Cohaesibacter sp.]|uniref:MalY/PatB family protein n=1 Tax=uncultured Cohaesibacter sp. TaxID=1002546 RepID=UPI0029C63D35|nr:aminotransferase class I/II-fold pyridoxal phosphate-dependent enzyme [uncultured Cohaesibacter sp.]
MIEFLTRERLRLRASGKWVDFAEDILPSNPAEMDFAIAPVIMNALQSTLDNQKFGYASHGDGGPEARLKAAFKQRMKDRFDWEIDTATTLPVSNLVQAVAASIWAFSEEGDKVALQVPAYPMFHAAIAQTRRTAVCNVMPVVDGRYELDVEALVRQIDEGVKILLLCHPHNPTGRVFSKEELEPVARLAKAHGLTIISDEIHSDILFDGLSHVPFAKMFPDLSDRTITLYSASKTFNIPGLACAVMHFGSDRLQAEFEQKVPAMLLGHPGITGLVATTAAWEEGDSWARENLAVLQSNRDHFVERFWKEMPEVGLCKPQATYLAWADFSAFTISGSPFEFLRDKGRVMGGNGANFGKGYEQFVRFNYATSPEILDEKIDRIFRALKSNSNDLPN